MMTNLRFTICDLPLKRRCWHRHRGFSFTEIMFAVIILGVGFIMVAAIFPVAIQQAKNTTEETTAAAIARGATTYLAGVLKDGVDAAGNKAAAASNCPPGLVAGATPPSGNSPGVNVARVQQPPSAAPGAPAGMLPLWQATRANLVLPEDPRYGFIYLYRRGMEVGGDNDVSKWSPYIQLYIFPVQTRVTTIFDVGTLNTSDYAKGNLLARPNTNTAAAQPAQPIGLVANVVDSTATSNAAQVDYITFTADPKNNQLAAVEGAYVIVADDNFTQNNTQGRVTGQIFKLGSQRTDIAASTWELQPGSDYKPDAGPDNLFGTGDDVRQLANIHVFVIGRANTIAPANATSDPNSYNFDGPALPIAAYTTFVKVQ